MEKQQRQMARNFLTGFLLIGLLWHCQSGGPKKIENFRGNLPATDVEGYRKAYKNLQIGKTLYNRKQYKRSLEKAEQSINGYPFAEAWYLKGLNHSALEDYPAAQKAFAEAHKKEPNNEQMLLTHAVASRLAGDGPAARGSYEKLTRLKPSDAIYRFQLGLSSKETGDYQRAVTDFKKADALGYKPKDTLYVHLGEAYSAQNKDVQAESYYNKAARLNPKNRWAKQGKSIATVKAGMNQGKKALQKKDYKAAIGHFKKVEKANPDMAVASLFLGISYYHNKEYKNARAKLGKALSQNTELEEAYIYLAKTFEAEKNSSAQLKTLNQGEKNLPKSFQIAYAKGLYYKDQGDYSEALKFFLKSKTLKKDVVAAYSQATFIYLQQERYAEAKSLLREAESSVTADDAAQVQEMKKLVEFASFEQQTLALLQKGAVKDAEKNVKSKQSRFKELAGYYNIKGRVCFARNRYKRYYKKLKGCEKSYKKGLKIDKKHLPTLVNTRDLYTFQLKKVYKKKSKGAKKTKKKLAKIDKLIAKATPGGYVQPLLKGIALEKKSKYDGAIKVYKPLKKKYPAVKIIKTRLAYCYLQKASAAASAKRPDYKKAFAFIKLAESEDKTYPALTEAKVTLRENQKLAKHNKTIQSARGHEKKENYGAAAKDWQKLYKKIKTPEIMYRWARATYNADNSSQRSDKIFSDGEKRFKKHPRWALVASRYHADKKDYDLSRKSLGKYIKKHNRSAEAYYRLGILDLKEQKNREALSQFQQSLDHDTNYTPARVGNGVALYRLKKFKASRETFKEIISDDKYNGLANLNLGVSYFSDDLFKEARRHLKRAEKSDQLKADANYYLGFINYLEKKYDKAEKNLRISVADDPEEIYLYGLYKTLGKQKKSRKLRSDVKRELVTRYPAGKYTARVLKGASAKVGPTSKARVALGRFNWPHSIKARVHLQNDRMYFFDKSGLHCYRLNQGNRCFNKSLRFKPVDLVARDLLFILFTDHVAVHHPHNGDKLHEFYLPEGGAKSLSVLSTPSGYRFAVRFKKVTRIFDYNARQIKKLKVSKNQYGWQNGLIYAKKDALYFAEACKKCKARRLKVDLEGKVVALQGAGNRLLVTTEKKSYYFDITPETDEVVLKELYAGKNSSISLTGFSAHSLAVVEGKQLRIIEDDLRKKVKLPVKKPVQLVVNNQGKVLLQSKTTLYLLDGQRWVKLDGATAMLKRRGRALPGEIFFAQTL